MTSTLNWLANISNHFDHSKIPSLITHDLLPNMLSHIKRTDKLTIINISKAVPGTSYVTHSLEYVSSLFLVINFQYGNISANSLCDPTHSQIVQRTSAYAEVWVLLFVITQGTKYSHLFLIITINNYFTFVFLSTWRKLNGFPRMRWSQYKSKVIIK